MTLAWWCFVGVALGTAGERADAKRVTRLVIEYKHSGWRHEARTYVVEARKGGKFSSGERTIDASLVDAVATAAVANLHPSDGMSTCSSHTDDSPSFHVTIKGRRTIELFSTSHCARNAPWNVARGGELFVQYDASVAPPLYALLAVIEPERWKPSPPKGVGHERLLLGATPSDYRGSRPAGVKRSASRAAACARSVEASAEVRAALGGPVTITHLSIGCDVEREPACRRTEARGWMAWRGIDLRLPFTCVDETVDAASFSAPLAVVTPFVDSKVFAAWLSVAGGKGTLELELPGALRLRSLRAPEVWYNASTQTIDVRAQDKAADAPFWTALGIDPSTRIYEGPDHYQSSRARLDLAGRLLPDIRPAKEPRTATGR
jgi:hypothetical protein